MRAMMLAGLEGDDAAYKKLLSRLSAYLRGYFNGQFERVGRSAADAEDLVQETLIALHTRRHTYDRSQLLTPWVHAIARYRMIDFLRRTKSVRLAIPVEDVEDLIAEDESPGIESRLDLEDLLSQLKPRTRQVIQLVKLDGLSVSEAAERSNMSESAIKVTVHRGLKALAQLVRNRNPL